MTHTADYLASVTLGRGCRHHLAYDTVAGKRLAAADFGSYATYDSDAGCLMVEGSAGG
jgi:hypothetical protein